MRQSLIDLLLTNPHGWGNEPPRQPEPAYQDDAGNSYGFDGSTLDRWRTPQDQPQYNPSLKDSLLNIATSPAKLAYGMVSGPVNALARLGDNFVTEDGSLGLPNPQNPENQTDMATLLMTGFGSNALRTGRPGMLSSGPIAPKEPPKGITAYHGSPHDFDRFDSSKIGTGEGEQVFGRGLYFAESRDVADSYRKQLTGPDPYGSDPADIASGYIQTYGNKSDALEQLKAAAVRASPARSQAMQQALKYIQDDSIPTRDGHLYEVRLNAEPERFLDWDRPLSAQSEGVQKMLLPVAQRVVEKQAASDRVQAIRAGEQGVKWSPRDPVDPMTLTGAQIADDIDVYNSGLPGIRYLDEVSRGKGEGSHNYVVFDDSLIEILKKYGLAGLMAGGAAATTDETNALEAYRY